MGDDQKIWFIYLTDHHEGPFTAAEIADKAKAGLVSGQSLAWKDGMPEWVAAETIPELASAMANSAAVAEIAAADQSGVSKTGNMIAAPAPAPSEASTAPMAAGGDDGGVSLAQLLAQSQSQSQSQPAATTKDTTSPSGAIVDSASVLSSMVSNVHAGATSAPAPSSKSNLAVGGSTGQMEVPEPGPDEEVWTLKIGAQVSGLHSLRKLKELAGAGEIPPDAEVWHPGWSDFQAASTVPHIENARGKAKPAGAGGGGTRTNLQAGTRTGLSRPGVAMSALSNAALDNDDEPTDVGIEAPPPGFKGILFKIHTFVEKMKKKKAKGAAPAAAGAAKGKGAAVKKSGGAGGSAKRIGVILGGVAGAGAVAYVVYLFLFSSPIPSSVDVSDDDRQSMVEVVKGKGKLYLAQAKGTDEVPADPNEPKYFVASSLPKGTPITLTVTGVPGTLVNRLAFEKAFTANVEDGHVAVFEKISDDGKPLWGEFNLKVTAEGAEPLDAGKKFIGMKGAAYNKRLKAYKDNIQGDYDKELGELKEFIATLKMVLAEASKNIADYKQNWAANPASHAKITASWTDFNTKSGALLTQIDTSLKARQAPDKLPKYHGRAYQDVSTTEAQLAQLLKAHTDRLSGTAATANADELEGLVTAGVTALEAWVAGAISKTPFDQKAPEPAKAPPAATPAPATTPPAAPAAPATPATTPAAPAATTPAPATTPAAPATPAPAPAAAAPAAAAPAAAPAAPAASPGAK